MRFAALEEAPGAPSAADRTRLVPRDALGLTLRSDDEEGEEEDDPPVADGEQESAPDAAEDGDRDRERDRDLE